MARHNTSEEQKLKTVLQRLPFDDEEKTRWLEIIDDSGLNEDLAKEILHKAAELPRVRGRRCVDAPRRVVWVKSTRSSAAGASTRICPLTAGTKVFLDIRRKGAG
jgi:hypothetical protein